MQYVKDILAYTPRDAREEADKALMLQYITGREAEVLTRESLAAHITSSGFVVNEACDKALLVHHNIRNTWAWTGGHADGEGDLLAVALREAQEETGVLHVRPLQKEIASLDSLIVYGHWKKGVYVSVHLHLSVAYLLVCREDEALHVREGENTAVQWFPFSFFTEENFDADDVYLYSKLIERAKGEERLQPR